MQTNETKTEAEVVLTPFLGEVQRRAEARGFEAKACTNDGGQPWLSIRAGYDGTVSVFGPGRHILTADAQNLPPAQLIERAHRVALVAHELLDNGPAEHCFACGTKHTGAEVCVPRSS